jgi:hypothetical protein
MAKFEVMVTEFVERAVRYHVSISQKEVVEALSLEGEDKKEWKEHVEDYCQGNWDEVQEKPTTERGDLQDEEVTSFEIASVSEEA